MKTADDLFKDIDRLGEQIAIEIDAIDASRRDLEHVIASSPTLGIFQGISTRLESDAASLREFSQALGFTVEALRRLVGERRTIM